MTNLDSLHAKKDVLMLAVGTSRRKIFVFEFINCANVPPHSRDEPTTDASSGARLRWLVNKRYGAELNIVVNNLA